MAKIPRLVIGACQGRSGKTTFTLGLLRALTKKGYNVQPFKKGPDYIDPSWLSFATGNSCRNLDAFMMDSEQLVDSFIDNSENMDISIVEGAMGLFDGLDVNGSNSTAQIAHLIDAPVILVVNCQRMTRSVAALVNGVVHFDPRIKIGGVILNNVARSRHKNILTESIEKYCNVPVLGILPKSKDIAIPDRHLGLVPAGEQEKLMATVDRLGELVLENVDLDKLMEIATGASILNKKEQGMICQNESKEKVKIGVIKDKAFSFYYPENIDALQYQGADIVYINSMEDKQLPKIDGLFIGGGFPEMLAEEIESNTTLREDIRLAVEDNMPIYAECGGLMYLGRSIISDEKSYAMVGALPFDVRMEKKPQGHGYTIHRITGDHPFLPEGLEIRGHEFHNSKIINLDMDQTIFALDVQRGHGIAEKKDGIVYKNTFASYNHLHAASVGEWAEGLVKQALKYSQKIHV